MECYSGGSIVLAIFGTIFIIALLGVLAWWIYKKYFIKHQKDTKLVPDDDPENAKHEFAFDNLAFKGDGNKSTLNANWTLPKNAAAAVTNDKRKQTLDDSYAGMTAPRLVSLKGSDFTGLGIECYGGLKDGIFVKKVASQGPASGHINIGDRITSLTIDFRHIVQEDAMTILSYASPYNVQLELINGNNNRLRSSGGSSSRGGDMMTTASPKEGRQSPLVHPLVRSSSQSDLNTIERNSRKKLYQNDDKDYPTLKMDKNNEAAAAIATQQTQSMTEANNENEKKSPSFIQQFKTRIAKIEEKFQTRSRDEKSKAQQDAMNMEEGKVNDMKKRDDEEAISPDTQSQDQSKKGLKFGIRVLPTNVNEKLFGKSKSKTPSPPPSQQQSHKEMSENLNDVKIDMDQVDGGNKMTTEVTIECENFNRQGSMQSSIKRDVNGIPQELPAFMANAASAAKEGRNKMGTDAEMRKSKGKAPPRPPLVSVDLNESTQTMDTNLTMSIADISTESINNMTANNTNNVNMEIEDELDRITEKYLNQSKDKLNFSDNFANSSMLNNTDGSVTLFDKIEELKDDIDDVILRQKEPSNCSTPKSDRKDLNKDFEALDATSDLDLSNYGSNRTELNLNSSDIIVHQSNSVEDDVQNDETRRAASLGDLSLMKKSLTEKDGNNSSTLERAQSLDITDNNNLMPNQSLAMGLSKPTDDLTVLNHESDPTIYQNDDNNDDNDDDEINKTDQTKMNNYENETNIPDDVKVIRYPLGTMEREPKSDVLKKILGSHNANMQKIEMEVQNELAAAPNNNIVVDASENVPMTNGNNSAVSMKSVVTIENNSSHMNEKSKPMEVLSIDTLEQQPVSLTLVNNTIDINSVDPNHMSPIFASDTFGVNSIKISSVEVKPVTTTTLIKNDGFYVKDNVVTISTDSQPSSIQFIDDVKLDFNMQVLDDFEKDDKIMIKDDFKPKIVEAEIKEKLNGNHSDSEINNNNVSKTTISHEIVSNQQQQMNKFLTEIVFKGQDDSAIEDMTTSEETATLTSSTMSNASSDSSSYSPPVMTSTKTLTLTNVPLSTANFIKNERKHIEKNFIPHNNDIKVTTTVYENSSNNNNNHHHHLHHNREPAQKKISQIEQIRQNFEKSSVQNSSSDTSISIPIPVARRSSAPLNVQKTTPSKIPVFNFNKKSSPTNRTSSNNNKMSSSSDSVG